MTGTQQEELINYFDAIAGDGGQMSVNGGVQSSSDNLIASLSGMDKQSLARLFSDLATIKMIMENNKYKQTYKPKYSPHVDIKLDSDNWLEGVGTTWPAHK